MNENESVTKLKIINGSFFFFEGINSSYKNCYLITINIENKF